MADEEKKEKFDITALASYLPTIQKPERKLTFNEKVVWTGVTLILFFIMGSIFVYGVNPEAVANFEFLEIVFGSKFGSIITLGIGPIVTASIILQLLVGSKIINWDLQNPVDKAKFTGAQKLLTITFSILEAVAYVGSGAVPPASPELMGIVMAQIAMGGILIMYMDDVITKWGIGSGVSLFIAAGVSKTIILRLFNPFTATGAFLFGSGAELPGGILLSLPLSLASGQLVQAFGLSLPLIATLVVFGLVVYAQSMKVEIPMAFSLPFGKFAARRWPLKFIYTSNMPVILAAAVLANVQLFGRMLSSAGFGFLGTFDAAGSPIGGLAYYVTSPTSVGLMIAVIFGGLFAVGIAFLGAKAFKKYILRLSLAGLILGLLVGWSVTNYLGEAYAILGPDMVRGVSYMISMITLATIFSIFWVHTSGMDAKSVAGQFQGSNIVIPGFRRDPRIVERVLQRYIPALTVLGGAFVGMLAGFADLTNALGTGTGILLTVMIIFQLHEQIMQQHGDDLPESVKKLFGDA